PTPVLPPGSPILPGRSLTQTSRDLGRLSTKLTGLGEQFRGLAGPSRSFGEEHERTLRSAIGGGPRVDGDMVFQTTPPDPTAVEAAKSLLSAEYKGPEGLDE